MILHKSFSDWYNKKAALLLVQVNDFYIYLTKMSKNCDWDGKGKDDALTIYQKASEMVHPILYKCLNEKPESDGDSNM